MKPIKHRYRLGPDAKFSIEYARAKNGACPAEDFLEGLEPAKRAKIDAIIKRFHECGVINNRQQMVNLKGKPFFELKHFQIRVIAYYHPKRRQAVVLTHGFIKKGDKTPKNEIDRAIRLKKEYEEG